MKKPIRSQRDWEATRPDSSADKERRPYLQAHDFDKTMQITVVDVPEERKPRPGTIRREIFDKCLVTGWTVDQVNKEAKKVHRSAEKNGDLFIGLQAGAVRLP